MNNRVFGVPVWLLSIIILNSLFIFNIHASLKYTGNIKSRFETGEEINPYSFAPPPGNLTDRDFFELYFNADFTITKIPWGKRLRLGMRLFEFQPSKVERYQPGLEYERRLDKIYAQLSFRRSELWLGDFYETFGRGLALNLMENRDLYFDSGLRGGKLNLVWSNWRLKALLGESRDGYSVNREQLAALNMENRPARGLKLGSSLVYQKGVSLDERYTPGLYIQMQKRGFSFFGEYAQIRPNDLDIFLGDGTYLNFTWGLMGLALNLEYKYYNFGSDHFEGDSLVANPFQTPPVVQREITTHLMTQHPHLPRISDQVGFNIEISGSPREWIFITSSFSRASLHDGISLIPSLNEAYNPFWEWFTEAELFPSNSMILKLALGTNEEARPLYWQGKTGTLVDMTYYLTPLTSLTFAGENMWVDDKINDEYHQERYVSLTLAKASLLSLNLSYQWTTEELEYEDEQWPGGEIALIIKGSHRLTVFYGKERGGLKCTSGVCRPVQPFEGLRVTLESAF